MTPILARGKTKGSCGKKLLQSKQQNLRLSVSKIAQDIRKRYPFSL